MGGVKGEIVEAEIVGGKGGVVMVRDEVID